MKSLLLLVMVFATAAHAQTLNPRSFEPDAPNVVSVGLGVDGPMVASLGYSRVLPLSAGPNAKTLTVIARGTLPFRPDLGDWALHFGGQLEVLRSGGWVFAPRLEVGLLRSSAVTQNITAWGTSLGLVGGYFGERLFVAAEVGWQKAWVTSVSPTALYRQNYPGAKEGLYVSGGGLVEAGLQVGVRLAGHTELSLRVGRKATELLGSPTGLPFYGVLGLSQGF